MPGGDDTKMRSLLCATNSGSPIRARMTYLYLEGLDTAIVRRSNCSSALSHLYSMSRLFSILTCTGQSTSSSCWLATLGKGSQVLNPSSTQHIRCCCLWPGWLWEPWGLLRWVKSLRIDYWGLGLSDRTCVSFCSVMF